MAMIKLFNGFYVNSEDIITVEATPDCVTLSIRQYPNTISLVPHEVKEDVKGKQRGEVIPILQAWVDAFVTTIINQQRKENSVNNNVKPKRTIGDLTRDVQLFKELCGLEFDLERVSDTEKRPLAWLWTRVSSDTIETDRGVIMNDLKEKITMLKKELNVE